MVTAEVASTVVRANADYPDATTGVFAPVRKVAWPGRGFRLRVRDAGPISITSVTRCLTLSARRENPPMFIPWLWVGMLTVVPMLLVWDWAILEHQPGDSR